MLWCCWLCGRKGIWPFLKQSGVVVCLEQGADLHMAQLMPLPLTVSCFSKIQIGFTFLVPAHLGSPRKRAVKRVCLCVCVSLYIRTVQDQVYSTLTKYTVVDQMLKFGYGHIFLSRFMAATKNPDIRQRRGRLTCSLCMCDCSAQVWPRRQQQQSWQQRQEMSTDNCQWQRSSQRYCWY